MTTPTVLLSSDQPLEDVDSPFKLSAGPGAGKTHWLAGHVKAVIAKGARLHGRAKVACITYTQIGSETLAQRLVGYEDRLWISTIHCFLYHQVVRPYAHALGEGSLVASEMDGHELRRPSIDQGKRWLSALGKPEGMWFAVPQLADLLERDVRWNRGTDGRWTLGFRRGSRLNLRGGIGPFQHQEALLSYKHSHWGKGRIDHDDVIYLSHRVLNERPGVLTALVHRFPYLFMDEFQDTSQLQSEIVGSLAQAGTIVGVIGDRKQAIYEFSDADPTIFDAFEPTGCVHCKIEGNRRSTAQIVAVLNHLRRDDLRQESIAKVVTGPVPLLLIGDLQSAIAYAKEQSAPHILDMVARGHAGVTKLLLMDGMADADEIWRDCSDRDRERFLRSLCLALRYFLVGEGRQAVTALSGLFQGREARAPLQGPAIAGERKRRSFRVDLLGQVVSFRRAHPDGTVMQIYNTLASHLLQSTWGISLKSVRGGQFFSWASTLSFDRLVASVNTEATRAHVRTIHGFKGDETKALLVLLDSEKLRKKLSHPADTEEDRLMYVALSRASERLYVVVPDLPAGEETALRRMGFDAKRL